MEIAQDHKRAFDNDEGLNTGGMGAYCPLKKITQDDVNEGLEKVVQPMVDAMSSEGMPFYGILYAGLMKCADGVDVYKRQVHEKVFTSHSKSISKNLVKIVLNGVKLLKVY